MSRKDQLDHIDDLVNKGDILEGEAINRRRQIENLSDSDIDKLPPVRKLEAATNYEEATHSNTFEDKVLIQLELQNDKLQTIKAVVVFYLICSVLSIGFLLYGLNPEAYR
jgi:hypothetical protein